MSRFKDISLVDFVEDVLEIKLTHTQMVTLELYEDLRLNPFYTLPQHIQQWEPGKPYVTTRLLNTKGECLDGRD